MTRIEEWGHLLLSRGFKTTSTGSAPKYLAINGMGALLEIFLPKRYIRVVAIATRPEHFEMFEYLVVDPFAPKNAFFDGKPAVAKVRPQGEITKLLKQL